MSSFRPCPECGERPFFEHGSRFIDGFNTVMLVHIGKCLLAGRTEYYDMKAAELGWNKKANGYFEMLDRGAKRKKIRHLLCEDETSD